MQVPGNDPSNNTDPTGQDCFSSSLGVAAGVLAFGGAVLTAPETFGGSFVIVAAGLFSRERTTMPRACF